jgi:hypothetical protein
MATPAPYRFVGTTKSGFFGTKYEFQRFGQTFEMDPELADSKIAEGFPIMAEPDWQKLSISEADLKAHVPKILTNRAPTDFWDKVKSAWTAHEEIVKSKQPVAPAPAEESATDKE